MYLLYLVENYSKCHMKETSMADSGCVLCSRLSFLLGPWLLTVLLLVYLLVFRIFFLVVVCLFLFWVQGLM